MWQTDRQMKKSKSQGQAWQADRQTDEENRKEIPPFWGQQTQQYRRAWAHGVQLQ